MLDNIQVEKVEPKEFELIPPGLYDCIIENVDKVERTKYQSTATEEAIRFTFRILGGEFADRLLFKTVSPKWNAGFEGGQPSNLYVIMKAVRYHSDNVPTTEDINSSVGQEVKVYVKIKEGKNGQYNVVDDVMAPS